MTITFSCENNIDIQLALKYLDTLNKHGNTCFNWKYPIAEPGSNKFRSDPLSYIPEFDDDTSGVNEIVVKDIDPFNIDGDEIYFGRICVSCTEKYNVCHSAEGETYGEIFLRPDQAAIVDYATNPTNWANRGGDGYGGAFYIRKTEDEEFDYFDDDDDE